MLWPGHWPIRAGSEHTGAIGAAGLGSTAFGGSGLGGDRLGHHQAARLASREEVPPGESLSGFPCRKSSASGLHMLQATTTSMGLLLSSSMLQSFTLQCVQAIAGHLSAFGIYTNLDTDHGQVQISRYEARRQSSPAAQPQEGVNGQVWAVSDSRGSEQAVSLVAADLNGASPAYQAADMPEGPSSRATDRQTDRRSAESSSQGIATAAADDKVNGLDKSVVSGSKGSELEAHGEPSTAGLEDESKANEDGNTWRQAAAKKAAVEWDTVDGDFMSGWTSLADWQSARTVEPAKR